MKTLTFEDRDSWLHGRIGKITGSGLADVVSSSSPTKEMMVQVLTRHGVEVPEKAKKEDLEKFLTTPELKAEVRYLLPKKKGYYDLIAARLGVPPDGENPMERGSRLEAEGLERFAQETGKKLDFSLLILTRDDDENVAISPDAVVIGEKAAVECKCLSAGLHIKAYLTQEIPDEYWLQTLQYFITDDELETLYFVFYDPRFAMFSPGAELRKTGKSSLDFFYIKVEREEVKDEVAELLEFERMTLADVNAVVAKLTF